MTAALSLFRRSDPKLLPMRSKKRQNTSQLATQLRPAMGHGAGPSFESSHSPA